MKTVTIIAAAAVALLLFCFGWIVGLGQTQIAVARDCDRLGGFYVGAEVYRCARAPGEPPPRPSGQKGIL